MTLLYDLIFLVIILAYLPVYLIRGKFHGSFIRRFGVIPLRMQFESPIWVHAVSVGEAMAANGLIAALREQVGSRQFVISTVTTTGNTIAKRAAVQGDFVTYLPFDFSWTVNRFLDRVRPSLLVIMETELWPNLITSCHRRGIPVVVVNCRISDRSFRGYRLIGPVMRALLARISLLLAQSDRDAQRLLRLGVPPERLQVTGNLKFDAVAGIDTQRSYSNFRRRLGIAVDARILIAGSTHPGEEELVLEAYSSLRHSFADLKLIIAPRHPERASAVARSVEKHYLNPVLISSIHPPTLQEFPLNSMFILDTVGELVNYYAISDIVFVGGSLVRRGGQNILEPAVFAKPVICGMHTTNFRDIVEAFVKQDAVVRVRTGIELKDAVRALLEDPARAAELGTRARSIVSVHTGATARVVNEIRSLCSKNGLFTQ